MKLSDEQREAVQRGLSAVHAINDALNRMRELGIACNIRDTAGYWLMDMKAIIRKEHYE